MSSSRVRPLLTLLSTIVLLGAVAACGSDSGDDSGAGAEPAGTSSAEESVDAAASGSSSPADGPASDPASDPASSQPAGSGTASGAAADLPALPQDIIDRGVLRVATAAAYPPDQFVDADTSEVTGWSPDMLTEVAERLGVTVEFTDMEFAGILPGVQSGKFDIGSSSFAVTDERAKAVDFVTYSRSGDTLLVKNGNPKDLSFDAMCGTTTGVTKGSVSDFSAQRLSEECTEAGNEPVGIQAFPNQNGAILALESGRVDSVIAAITVNGYLAQQSGNKFEAIDSVLDEREVGYTFKKGSTELEDAILAALLSMQEDGTYQDILDEWGVGNAAFDDASGFRAVR